VIGIRLALWRDGVGKMRSFCLTVALVAVLFVPTPTQAQSRAGFAEGFGGLTFGDTASASTFGGGVAVNLTPNIQVIGEVGRMSDLKPSILDQPLAFTSVNMHLSAFYGEGGVRYIVLPHSRLRPYAEATAGFARLNTRFTGAGAREDSFVNAGLKLLDRTEPLLGVGGGVMLQTGPVVVDLGYRYKKVLTDEMVVPLVSGTNIGVNQFRVGVGVGF
jgi:hypothetical protein